MDPPRRLCIKTPDHGAYLEFLHFKVPETPNVPLQRALWSALWISVQNLRIYGLDDPGVWVRAGIHCVLKGSWGCWHAHAHRVPREGPQPTNTRTHTHTLLLAHTHTLAQTHTHIHTHTYAYNTYTHTHTLRVRAPKGPLTAFDLRAIKGY